MKNLMMLIIAGMFVFSRLAYAHCGKCDMPKDETKSNDPVKDVVMLPVKTVQAVGEVVTGQAGKDTETKPAETK